jgi:cell division protein FtsZ
VNVDFADVKSVMQDAGTALMGIGYGTGDSRAAEAARAAIDSPLLETSIHGAQGILFNITGGNDLSMFEVDEAARIVTEASAPEANIIFGAVIDEAFTGQVKCTVVATGFVDDKPASSPAMANPAQKLMKGTFSRPASDKVEVKQAQPADSGIKSQSPMFDEGELEVPAFMRKPLSK